MRRNKYFAVDAWHCRGVICDVYGRNSSFAILNCKDAINSNGVIEGDVITMNVESDVRIFSRSNSIARIEVADGINLVASTNGSIDVVLKIVVINVATDGSFSNSII